MFLHSPIFIISFFHVLNDGFRIAIIALIPYLAKTLNLTYTQAGFLGSCLVGIQALTTLPASMVARKKGDLIVLRAGLICYSIAILALRTSLWYPIAIIIYSLAGVGFSAFHPIGSAFVAKSSPRNQLGKNLGLMTSAGDLGKIVIPALATFLLTKIGWQPTTCILGGLGILALFTSYGAGSKKKASFIETKVESMRDFIRKVNLALIKRKAAFVYAVILSALDCFTQEPINIFLPFLALSITGKQEAIGIALSAYFAGSLLGKNLLGILADKRGSFSSLLTAEIGMIIFSFLIGFSKISLILYIISFLLGIFSKGTSPVIKTMLGESVSSTSYNIIFGLSETTDAIADAFSPVFFGLIADLASLRTVFLVNIFFIMLMILFGFSYRKKSLTMIEKLTHARSN
ncbi:MAG TPA: MFS transporter [Candidatus Bathyarchaeia archaeon]|nr:MFS transporter [Candidatus Bathyarchaeia archaeon]